MSYAVTKNRIAQWLGIILIIGVFAGAYWYFKVYGSTLNAPRNDLNTNGLVGLWSFNGDDISGTTAYDRSGSGNNGTLTNGPAVTQGKVGQALDFDGTNDYVSTADYSYSNAQAFTMSVWFKADTVSGNQVIFSKETYEYNLRLTDATLAFAYWDTGGVGAIDLSYSNVAANRWYLVGVTYDGSGAAYMYVDGVRVASDTNIVNTFQNKAEALRIGGGYHISGNPGYLNGQIDEMRVYNRALSAGEIQSLYAAGGGTKIDSAISQPQGTGRLDSGLGGYWKLDDGSGTSATDSSTNSYTGTLTSGPTWTTGQIGSAVAFDGTDDYIDTDNGSALDSLSEYSYAAWIYPTSANGFILAKASGGGGSSGFRLISSTLQGWRANFTAWSEARSTSSTTVSLNTWSHVVMTYSHIGDKKHHIYLNGVEVAYSEQDTNPVGLDPDSGFDYWIGRKQGVNEMADVPFTGNIDEARIYNRPLSVSEVTQLYRLTAPTSVDTGLKGYWSFNGKDVSGTSAYDRSGAGNTGTLTGGPSITEGKLAQGLSFDGTDDYVSVADADVLSPAVNDLTVSVWAKVPTNALSIGAGNCANSGRNILGKGGNGSNYEYAIENDANSLLCYTLFTSVGGGYSSISVSRTMNDGQWHLYTMTVDYGVLFSAYIDGVLVGSTTSFSGSMSNTASAFRIGDRGDSSYFSGQIDEVRVYNRALMAAEIKGLYDVGADDKTNSAVSQPQGTGRLDSGLAGYWKLDDGSGTSATDSSTNANTGTLTNGPTWTTGQVGGAVAFDGTNDRIVTTHTTNLNTYPITVSTWVKTSVNDASRRPIVSKYSFLNGYALYMLSGKVYAWYMGNGSNYVYTGTEGIVSTTTVSDDAWHHAVFTVDTTGGKLYIDGNLEASRAWTGTPQASTTTNGLGLSYPDGGSFTSYLAASIDDTRVYNRALSADEVAQLYRLNAPTGTDTGLKGYWSFNGKDMSGTTAYDRSGAGNTGTLTNGPAITEGKIGQGLSFDGTDDYVNLGTGVSLGTLSPMSLSTWVRVESSSTNQTLMGKITAGAITRFSLISVWGAPAGRISFIVDFDGTDIRRESGGGALVRDTWQHVVITWDGSTSASNIHMYVNGTEVSSYSTTTDGVGSRVDDSATNLVLASSNGQGSYLTGKLDEVRVYNRVLSAAEIKSLYNSSR